MYIFYLIILYTQCIRQMFLNVCRRRRQSRREFGDMENN